MDRKLLDTGMTQNYVVFVFLDFAKNDEICRCARSLIVGDRKKYSFDLTFSSEPTNQHTLEVPDHKKTIKFSFTAQIFFLFFF